MNRKRYSATQRGAALMVAMMFLLVLTMLGLAAVRATTQQTRMAAGMQFQAAAFQASEAAIRAMYNQIVGATPQPAALLVNAQAAPISSNVTFGVATTTATISFTGGCPGTLISGASIASSGLCCFDIVGAAQYGSSNAASVQEQRIRMSCPLLTGFVTTP